MRRSKDKLTVIYQKGKKRMVVRTTLNDSRRVVVVLNAQFTNAPNTTQIASGAGRSSAAGNNAAIASANTKQQQSVGAGGKAKNSGITGGQREWRGKLREARNGQEAVVVINDQIVKLGRRHADASATQVAGGGGTYSTGGTNAAIESSNTKQQHAVGGGPGSRASNSGMGNRQKKRAKAKEKLRAAAKRKRRLRTRKGRKRKSS
ncbi:hypothetical protein EDM57_11765 [Brevibacillus gelatini]|uniref:Uncharacterized protein n=1 Tax=Brevibacillus gelatini TaxID=1655277 RepID=A0A3M8B0M4_9BACL|nr:hypothetical protein EDM57_11765 [Brevibacillus gelatini]